MHKEYENVLGTCDCVPNMFSSKSCRKCGRRAVMTAEHFNECMINLSQYHYVLSQIRDGVSDGQAQDMAKRVLDGERSVRPN
jgi:hypothetical protein